MWIFKFNLIKIKHLDKYFYTYVHKSTTHITIARSWKQPKCPSMDGYNVINTLKLNVIDIYGGMLLSILKRMKF